MKQSIGMQKQVNDIGIFWKKIEQKEVFKNLQGSFGTKNFEDHFNDFLFFIFHDYYITYMG